MPTKHAIQLIVQELKNGKNIDGKLKNDLACVLAATEQCPYQLDFILKNLGEKLKKDQDAIKYIVLKAVQGPG